MKFFVVLLLTVSAAASFAKPGHHHHGNHREHGAHVHGAGNLNIAFDGTQGKVDFESAAMGIVGFEHAAKTEKQKKAVADAISRFESQIQTIVQMDPSLACQFSKEKIEVRAEKGSSHSDFVASFKVNCGKAPLGSAVTVDFSKYPKLKNIEVVALAGEVQKTLKVSGKPLRIELKP